MDRVSLSWEDLYLQTGHKCIALLMCENIKAQSHFYPLALPLSPTPPFARSREGVGVGCLDSLLVGGVGRGKGKGQIALPNEDFSGPHYNEGVMNHLTA